MAKKQYYDSTQGWRNAVEVLDGIEDIKELLIKLKSSSYNWSAFINAEKNSRGLKIIDFAPRCGTSRQTVSEWLNKGVVPDSKKTFIKIGMALSMDLDEVNRMLQRYGKYPKLYVKNLNDAVCIYVIKKCKENGGNSQYAGYPYGHVEVLLKKITDNYGEMVKEANFANYYKTNKVETDVLQKQTDDEFLEFIDMNRALFMSKSYIKLQELIDEFVSIQYIAPESIDNKKQRVTVHALVTSGILNNGFENILTNLKAQDSVPGRIKIIALGIRFNLTTEMIDKLLELAKMEPLCAKDAVELVLIYAVRHAHLYDPTMEYDVALKLSSYSNDQSIRERSKEILKKHEDMTIEYYQDLPGIDCVSDYVKFVFEKLEMQEQASEFLELISD